MFQAFKNCPFRPSWSSCHSFVSWNFVTFVQNSWEHIPDNLYVNLLVCVRGGYLITCASITTSLRILNDILQTWRGCVNISFRNLWVTGLPRHVRRCERRKAECVPWLYQTQVFSWFYLFNHSVGVVVATCMVWSISWWCHYFGFLTTAILLTACEQFKHYRFTSKGLCLFVNVTMVFSKSPS